MNVPVTYRSLYEKYARREQVRSVASIISGAVAIAGGMLALRQLKADRAAIRAAALRRAGGHP